MSVKIKINPGLKLFPTIALSDCQDFQGDLKELNEINYNKLKKGLLEDGLLAPLAIWHDEKNKVNKLLDGHQRKRVFTTEAWLPKKLPYYLIPAKDEIEAKKKLLEHSSQYGEVTQEGYDTWTFDLPDEWKQKTLHFDSIWREFKPEFSTFKPNVDPQTGDSKVTEGDIKNADISQNVGISKTLDVVCPKCAHDFKINNPNG